jgi:uroporphyrinogen-III decarboxylase
MDSMTPRERLLAAHRGEPVDRPPIKIWAADIWTQVVHPSYQPILDLALEHTDLVGSWGLPVNEFYTDPRRLEGRIRHEERPSRHENFREIHIFIDTPAGELRRVYLAGTKPALPGYEQEYLCKTIEDLERWLSVPYEPAYAPDGSDCASFFERDREMGDRGVVTVGFSHPMYALQSKVGSTTFALWSIDHRAAMKRFLDEIFRRQMDYIRHVAEAGCGPIWGYVGPELCLPPLMSPRDFREFVVEYDRPIADYLHATGNLMWCHSHGNMNAALEMFWEMGVDVLNPLEPPPWGDLELAEARRRVGDRMTLEGNIEKDQLYRARPEEIRAQVRAALTDGPLPDGRRFILCPSAGFMEYPTCSEQMVENYRAYVDEAQCCCRERVWEHSASAGER